jgi:hypothetical protein
MNNSMKLLYGLLVGYCCHTSSVYAQLVVRILPQKMAGDKAVFPLVLNNQLSEKVKSVRAVMFLIDSNGKVVGQAAHWIVGANDSHPPLEIGATNAFNFVVSTSGKPFATNRLTVTSLMLNSGKSANPKGDVKVLVSEKP